MTLIKAQRLLCLLLLSIPALPALNAQNAAAPSDPEATRRTRALFANLRSLSNEHTLFGHQDDLAYGVYWQREDGRSDVQETCGAYPAVFGWELGRKFGRGKWNIDSVNYDAMRRWMRQVYDMGGVNTIGWHLDNLSTGGTAWDTSTTVRDILPGAPLHHLLVEQLDMLADYLKSLRSRGIFSHYIPVILRPWHEHTGSWFWWGARSCTPEEYVRLWRFTVDYLRNEKGLHHILYAYSPDVFEDESHYMRNYPGDEYVDILGLDYYYRSYNLEQIKIDLPAKLRIVADLAEQHGKVAAFTETGFETIPDKNWWTQMLLRQLQSAARDKSIGIAYVLVWRNAYHRSKSDHYYAPFPGQVSAGDFIQFSRDERIILQDRLPKLYKRPKNGSGLKVAGASLSQNK
ncbi:MAG: beta-mannosidase [Saprospiraceae bacterium]|nr:beta-mannosidase [Saprospiraceae bacterium]MCB0541938.1 beta-mannosidase [Saprospiraceae bacterium]MCB0573069.1 beta-mannosidase [Saprospiraceae bacterium]MCB9305399.1 beta-mannosidase [Lewinellaceae bacterium]MCB9355960.1 beta-mannosidase [Lewinellaceae bacterium]